MTTFNIPAGYKLVPLAPTKAMQRAAELAYMTWSGAEAPYSIFEHSDSYCAMLAAAPPVDAVVGEPVSTWPIHGIRVDRGTVVIMAKGNVKAADDAARWMCGELLAMKDGITADSARAAVGAEQRYVSSADELLSVVPSLAKQQGWTHE